MKEFIKIHSLDNVVVALTDLSKGTVIDVDGKEIKLIEDVKRGHKVALTDINTDENVVKYGYAIGHAISDIKVGQWVHAHNVKTNLSGTLEYSYNPVSLDFKREAKNLTFKGYRRFNNKVGIRNELWIVPTVGCVNGIGQAIIDKFKSEVKVEGIDGVEIFKHNFGCSQLGDDHENTRKILANLVKHPNAGGVLVLGLGCENNQMEAFKELIGEDFDSSRVKFMVSQEVSDEITEGAEHLKELYQNMKNDAREDISISELKVGLKCGGSDGLSGITANPLVGVFSDWLISEGGTTILTEVPEMFGAETILMDRCVTSEVYDKTVSLINDFKEYFLKNDQPVYENPSPGNKAGGISTLEDKSLGCTQKGGLAPVVDVLKYGEQLKTKGLNLLSAPGNDLVAATALAASGCHMVLFTTGRGTPFGTFVPTMKISTNSAIAALKPHWIDFNAGRLVEDATMEEVVTDFMNYIVNVASGEFVNNEKHGIREISIFKTGVTL